MVARSASQAGGFRPLDPPRVTVAGDGSLAAIHETSRVTILELPAGAAFAEVDVDPEALASEVAWVGAPPRLLVVARYAAHSTVHLLDPGGPRGPRTLAEIRLESPMRLFATVGASALVVGSLGAAVLSAGESHVTPYQFPGRVVPVAAGAAAGMFVVALAGAIEEWDPQSRLPRRRLRLPRVAAITAVGGSERTVWMTTVQEPARIDVIALVHRGQPRAHDLPEPIARIAGHPRSDLVVCVGADSGRLYVVDLAGRRRPQVIEPDGCDRVESVGLVVGRTLGVLAAQTSRPIAFVALDGRDVDGDPAEAAPPRDDAADRPGRHDSGPPEPWTEPAPASSQVPAVEALALASPPPSTPSVAAPPSTAPPAVVAAPTGSPARRAAPPPAPARPVAAPARPADAPARPAASVSERFSAWRDLVRQDQPRVDPVTRPAPAVMPAAPRGAPKSWRDEIVAWSRATTSGVLDHDIPAAPAIEAVLERFELARQLHPALALLYGAHLCGERGAAPVEIARVLDRRWDEALGRGELAQRGIADYVGSRVALVPLILRVLDDLPPATGTLVGEPGSVVLLGPCVVVAGDEPISAVAAQCLARVGGAILAARDDVDRVDLLFEARARGAVAMCRITAPERLPSEPVIFVVSDVDLADRLHVPRLT